MSHNSNRSKTISELWRTRIQLRQSMALETKFKILEADESIFFRNSAVFTTIITDTLRCHFSPSSGLLWLLASFIPESNTSSTSSQDAPSSSQPQTHTAFELSSASILTTASLMRSASHCLLLQHPSCPLFLPNPSLSRYAGHPTLTSSTVMNSWCPFILHL